MSRWIPVELTLKTARVPYKQSGTRGKENGTVPIMAEMDVDVVHWPTVGNEHWMGDHGWQTLLINSHMFPFGGTRDSILTYIEL